ncbi:MAG: type I-U CRISPR-associated protein Csb2 [Bryobacteraceae bacterium]
MQLILCQSFPLGRFHATPWRVNPFGDSSGEWPPSPWRFVRAVVARWHQWSRETTGTPDVAQLDALVRAMCESSYSFHLPVWARRGSPLRQYHPVEFGWDPKGNKGGAVPQFRKYSTSLVQDNYWCVPRGDAGAVWWFLDGDRWGPDLCDVLDRCLERLVYFGRAEALSSIRRIDEHAPPEPNCLLSEQPDSPTPVRVLVPRESATRTDVERVTDDPEVVRRTIPPGAKLMYAAMPPRAPARERPMIFPPQPDCHLIQLAVGWNVAPEPRATVRLTSRFRSAVLRELLLIKSHGQCATWSAAPASLRADVAEMFGKNAEGRPLEGHKHTEFLAWWQNRALTRVLAWRDGRPFDVDEQSAVIQAASRELSWAAAGPEVDAWKMRLIPLDAAVPPPPGFDGTRATVWESATPYVPPRHHLRGGNPRASESLRNQVRRELASRGTYGAELVEVDETDEASWMTVHVPRRAQGVRSFIGDRRGYWLRLTFPEAVAGPIRLGHSSSFGLGLFRPTG